ncbi:hypothetical protein, partial [Streptomyces hydrogenans]
MARVLAAAATPGFGGTAQADAVSLRHTPHVQIVGWKGKVCQGSWAGSIGEARNLEALRVEISYGSPCRKAHRATYGGDSGYRCANPSHSIQTGTVGMNTAIETIFVLLLPRQPPRRPGRHLGRGLAPGPGAEALPPLPLRDLPVRLQGGGHRRHHRPGPPHGGREVLLVPVAPADGPGAVRTSDA